MQQLESHSRESVCVCVCVCVWRPQNWSHSNSGNTADERQREFVCSGEKESVCVSHKRPHTHTHGTTTKLILQQLWPLHNHNYELWNLRNSRDDFSMTRSWDKNSRDWSCEVCVCVCYCTINPSTSFTALVFLNLFIIHNMTRKK